MISLEPPRFFTGHYPQIPLSRGVFLWGGNTRCALIATLNGDNANKDKKKAKAKLQATCNSYAERDRSIYFCKQLLG
jgi:hypothetical protein